MIVGIGCDIIEVARIKRAIERSEHFVTKLFTPAEISYCSAKADPAQSYAARFAAKEAVMKALGTGWDGKVNWLDIEIRSNELGNPFLVLSGGAKELADHKGVSNIQLSLSHEKAYALGYVLMESLS